MLWVNLLSFLIGFVLFFLPELNYGKGSLFGRWTLRQYTLSGLPKQIIAGMYMVIGLLGQSMHWPIMITILFGVNFGVFVVLLSKKVLPSTPHRVTLPPAYEPDPNPRPLIPLTPELQAQLKSLFVHEEGMIGFDELLQRAREFEGKNPELLFDMRYVDRDDPALTICDTLYGMGYVDYRNSGPGDSWHIYTLTEGGIAAIKDE